MIEIPRKYTVNVLINKRANLEGFFHSSLTKDYYLRTYNEVIHLVPDVKFWLDSDVQPSDTLPPQLKRKSGRLKKARIEKNEAPTVRQGKKSSILIFAQCKQFGNI